MKILKSKQLKEGGWGERERVRAGRGEPRSLVQAANCFSLCFSVPLEDELYFNYLRKDLS